MKLHFPSRFATIPPGHGLRQQPERPHRSRADYRGVLGTRALTLTLPLTSVLCFHETEGTSPGKPLPGLRVQVAAYLSVRFPHTYSASVTDSTGCLTTVKLCRWRMPTEQQALCHLVPSEAEGSLGKFKLKSGF